MFLTCVVGFENEEFPDPEHPGRCKDQVGVLGVQSWLLGAAGRGERLGHRERVPVQRSGGLRSGLGFWAFWCFKLNLLLP